MFDATTWDLPYPLIIITLFTIVMLRANGTYWLGRWIANGTERTKAAKLVQSKHYQRGAAWLNRWGAPAISLSFLTVGIQTMVNLAAGVTKMPLRRYLPAVTIGCIMWAFLYGTVGFVGLMAVQMLWQRAPYLVIAIIILLLCAIVWTILQRDKQLSDEAALEDPDSQLI